MEILQHTPSIPALLLPHLGNWFCLTRQSGLQAWGVRIPAFNQSSSSQEEGGWRIILELENLISSLSFAPNIYFMLNLGEIINPCTPDSSSSDGGSKLDLHHRMSPRMRNHKNKELYLRICGHSFTIHRNQYLQHYICFCQQMFTDHLLEVGLLLPSIWPNFKINLPAFNMWLEWGIHKWSSGHSPYLP